MTSSAQSGRLPAWTGWAIGGAILAAIAIAPWVVISNLLNNQAKQSTNPSPSSPASPALTPPTATLSPTPAVTPSATPSPGSTDPAVETVTFTPEQPTVQKTGQASLQRTQQYVVTLAERQALSVQVVQGSVTIDVRDPIGVILSSNTTAWQSDPTARAGSYNITVKSLQETQFSIVFTLTGGNPTPTPSPSIPSPQVSPTPGNLPIPSSPNNSPGASPNGISSPSPTPPVPPTPPATAPALPPPPPSPGALVP